MATSDIGITVINPAIPDDGRGSDRAVIYPGVPATLDVKLTNLTGGPITFQKGPPSTFEVFMPQFFTEQELQSIVITAPSGWTGVYYAIDQSLMLTFNGEDGTPWGDGTAWVFSLANVVASAKPASSSVQVNPGKYITGNLPSQVQSSLVLTNPPEPGNADIKKVLRVALSSQGSVYVSPTGDPLPNSLFLNFKNTGSEPIYSGKNSWPSTPQVIVTFVYGLTSGSLAPDSDKNSPQIGSAWNIVGAIQTSQGNQWQVISPDKAGQAPHPFWILEPINTSPGIIGTGDQANISFAFSKIVSFTPPGHTQMIVQFTGFPADDTRNYDDAIYVIDIAKQDAPPTRGLLNFYGKTPLVTVTNPAQSFDIDVTWAMFYVDNVNLICSFPGISPVPTHYPIVASIAYDSATVTISGVTVSTAIFLTLQSFDENGNYLNALQFTVFVNAMEFVDPRDNKVYPVVLMNGLVWMSDNLDWNAPGSVLYNNNGQYEKTYGRLYAFDLAQQVPAGGGWRLPSQADWNNLIAAAGKDAYQALMAGGSSGFNAQLGGQADNFGAFLNLGIYGYYWTSSQKDPLKTYIAQFSSKSSSVTTEGDKPKDFKISVRYVRNA